MKPLGHLAGGICTLHLKGGRAWLEAYRQHPIAWVERAIILAALITFIAASLGVVQFFASNQLSH